MFMPYKDINKRKEYYKEWKKKNRKRCSEKDLALYHKNKVLKGYKKLTDEQLRKNKSQQDKKYKEDNKEKYLLKSKEYYQKNKDIIRKKNKEYYQKNKDLHTQTAKKWRERNKDRLYTKHKHRMQTDLHYRIRSNLSRRFSCAVKRQKTIKNEKTLDILGCTLQEFKIHLESQFKEGMSWVNYGLYGWHIDHIKPCDLFNLCDPEQQKQCFHYTNLQPLWAKENLSKGNKYVIKV